MPSIDQTEEKEYWSINDFIIGPEIGCGRYGKVFLSREKESECIIALKTLKKTDLQIEVIGDQFNREVSIQTKLFHNNIIRLFGLFEDEDNVYLIQEYASGGNLYTKLKTNHHFSEELTANYIAQLSRALGHLQHHHIIHRDLKLENLLLSNEDEIKIADFGSAIQSKDARRYTICGTIDYLAPEILSGKGYDQGVDIWALGVLTFEMLVGRPPFDADSENATKLKIHQIQIPPLPDAISDVAKDFIFRTLTKAEERLSLTEILRHPFIAGRIVKAENKRKSLMRQSLLSKQPKRLGALPPLRRG
eukprot:TRINITY_DN788_c0_g1_i1.p1 TRINITY_DN788_c0_g1~~TRINITY_DN788_c0_g1_i1.p1  ORF type:complete len:305 (+),score=68.02 TRINITY_DN788_c0_g1_i1:30-944(+)